MPPPTAPTDPWEQERRRTAHQLLFAARMILILLGTLPWWLPLARASLPLGPVGQILDGVFIVACHRLPARTLTLAGVAMPLCSRCAGIYLGLALGALLVWPRLTMGQVRVAFAIVGSLMLLDVVAQDCGWHPMWHSTRIITGALVGWTASASFVAAIMRGRRLATTRPTSG